MHELSIANAIVAEVLDAMEAHAVGAVAEVTVRVGRLSGVVADSLEFGWSIVRQGTALANTALVIIDEPVVVWCPDGEHPLTLADMRFHCAEHGCATPEVLSGEGLEIVRLTASEESPSEPRSAGAAGTLQ